MYLLVIILVYNLSLAISLKVEYNRELNLNPKNIIKFILEIWYKLGTTVRDNWFRNAVKSVNVINIEAGYILYSYGFKIRERDGLFI